MRPDGVAVTLPVEDGLPALEYVELARLAERCGYDAVLAGEVSGPEVFGLLGLIAGATSTIGIGSGIVGCYARPPALTAIGFATLASAAPGRVIAGLGASSPVIVRDWFGGSFGRPLVAVEEFVAVLRQALSGARVSYQGQVVASEGFRATMAPPSPPVPVLLAAMNPAMLRLAGRIADGVFITWTPPGEVSGRLASVRDGEAAAGRLAARYGRRRRSGRTAGRGWPRRWSGCAGWCCSTRWCRRTGSRSGACFPGWTTRWPCGSGASGRRR